MATANRTVIQGETISLFIEVRNAQGVLVNSSTTPLVSIFDFDSDPRLSDTADSEALVLNDIGAVNIANGVYRYDYDVATDAHVGIWFDRWAITIDGVICVPVFQFEVQASSPVTDSASVESGTNSLLQNNVVVITLDKSIAATDGTSMSEDFQYYFTTEYSPLYSSVRRVRLRAGEYMRTVPDDTINLAIFDASLEADAITFGMQNPPESTSFGYRRGYQVGSGRINHTFFLTNGRNGQYFEHARKEYVTCMAIIYILSNSLGPAAKSKRLADFSVTYGDGALKEFMDDLKNECAEWERVIQTGGFISKGSSLPMRVTSKGIYNPDIPHMGRRMLENNPYPAANTKVRSPLPYSRWKHTFKRRG